MVVDQSAEVSAAPDYHEIARVVQLYIDGWQETTTDKFRECFHENAWISFTDAGGTLYQHPLVDSFESWIKQPGEAGVEWNWRMLSVTQAGDVASVLLVMQDRADPSSAWVDVHSLLRIDGAWRDMNKTATHASRAAWAGEGLVST